ncbi:MAG: 6-phosphogluconolactonase [Chitinophagaceae bacterium]
MTPQLTYKLEVFQTEDAITKAAAAFIIALAEKSVAEKGRFTLSLSGGQTPENLYSLLAEPTYSERMPWKNTYIFWGDERCVPANDKQNNANMAKTLLLDHIDIPAININPIPVDVAPARAAEAYEIIIKKFFGEAIPRFDLILLGLGENGHTASLFPGTDVVFENTRLIKEVYVAEQNMFRITMTPGLINNAHNIIFLVVGESKAAILKTILSGARQPDKFPAQIIKAKDGSLYWFIDKNAAALLPAEADQ